jgi:hypothetical protein
MTLIGGIADVDLSGDCLFCLITWYKPHHSATPGTLVEGITLFKAYQQIQRVARDFSTDHAAQYECNYD